MFYAYNTTLAAKNTRRDECAFIQCKGIHVEERTARLTFDHIHNPSENLLHSFPQNPRSEYQVVEICDEALIHDEAAFLKSRSKWKITQVEVHVQIPIREAEALRQDCKSSKLWVRFLFPIKTICIRLFPHFNLEQTTFKAHTADEKIISFRMDH